MGNTAPNTAPRHAATPRSTAPSRTTHASRPDYTPTSDRRYFVVRGRLWRLSNPNLPAKEHERLVRELMAARRAIRDASDPMDRIAARLEVDRAKKALGERGDVWWTDGSPDYNRRFAVDTPYAEWFRQSE